MLDDRGCCCGRKPIRYKGSAWTKREQFCPRCDRAYDYDTGVQIDNWAWRKTDDGVFVNLRKWRAAPPSNG